MSELKHRLAELRIEREEEEPERSRRWLPVALVALAVALGLGWWLTRPRALPVTTAVAREALTTPGQTVLNASGYVTARRRATVSSKVTGKVVEVLIEEGMEVAKGQVLARLDDTNLVAGLRLAEAELRSAETAVEETRVRLAEARRELARAERLAGEGVSSESELDRARAEADALAARLDSQGESAKVAARAVEVARRAVADTVIEAPFDGVVVSKNAQQGEMISPNSAGGGFTRTGIGTVVDMGSLEIEVDVNEAYIHRVTAGQQVTATLDAYPDWRIPTRVIAIVPTADRQKATVRVRIAFEELGDPRILPDMGVKVAFRSAEDEAPERRGVAVPAAAVRQRDGQAVVFVVSDGVAERRAVALGSGDEGEAMVVSGLAGGERVVVSGPAGLADGDRVREVDE